jgi:Dimerisation domain/Methyltransferase domain
MNTAPLAPDPDLVYGLYTGVYKPQLVQIALKLDVFTPLARGPADTLTIAEACSCSPAGMQVLLDYLGSIGLVERQADKYALTPTASTFLVRNKPSYVGDLVLAETAAETVEGYLGAVRTGRPWNYAMPLTQAFAQDAWLESYSSSRPTKSLEMWRLAGFEPGRTSPLRIVDLACGCAIKSLTLAQADPMVHITCVDRPEVLVVARDLAQRLGVSTQAQFLPQDLHTLDLGQARYDAALLGQITFYFTPEQDAELFRRVCAALTLGGALVIDTFMVSDQSGDWDYLASFFGWALGGGRAYSFAEYRQWLETAGFDKVKQLSERWLSARKA